MSAGGRLREVKDAGYGECTDQWEGSQKGGRLLCSSLDRKGAWERKDTCICMAEPLCYSPEAVIALLISCTPQYKIKT